MTTDRNPYASITKEHLLKALDWAQEQVDNGYGLKPLNGFSAKYDQNEWGAAVKPVYDSEEPECGTSCCVHGAAHLLARGFMADGPPHSSDYDFLPENTRVVLRTLMRSYTSKPAEMRYVIECDPARLEALVFLDKDEVRQHIMRMAFEDLRDVVGSSPNTDTAMSTVGRLLGCKM